MTRARTTPRSTAWVGWVWFAAVMIIMNGVFNALYGLVALFDDEFYAVGPRGLLLFDLTQWGWILLIFGILSVLAGVALIRGAMWARVVAVVLAGINALAHMSFMSAYPVWALLSVAIDVLIIWAIIAHGGEMKDESWD
ncbi:MAG TPA: hypothetical protein VH969_03640 [Actinophytocola sp.]|jgi:hypothetical protein|uniref:DUF7144 family membrane protein n=1 Tax=Actinophytocola sp. TaxID=1872138 RepID=UPI002F950104